MDSVSAVMTLSEKIELYSIETCLVIFLRHGFQFVSSKTFIWGKLFNQ